mgnify:FL=1
MDMLITPVLGQVYHKRNGYDYRCEGYMDGVSKMVRLKDGWTLMAHSLYQEDGGNVYWEYSTGGHWGNGYGN